LKGIKFLIEENNNLIIRQFATRQGAVSGSEGHDNPEKEPINLKHGRNPMRTIRNKIRAKRTQNRAKRTET